MAIVYPCRVLQENFIIALSKRFLEDGIDGQITGAHILTPLPSVVVVQNSVSVMRVHAHVPTMQVVRYKDLLWNAAPALMDIVGTVLRAHNVHQVQFQLSRYQTTVTSLLNVCLA